MQAQRLLFSALLLIVALCGQAQTLAFPEAEGYAAYATGGRGGSVVHVTNLNASGSGSLADAVSQPNRIVVFDVGGVIDITNSAITIASNVTVAGQTAPGGGITIYGGRVIASGNKNIILRYIRMRGGKSVNSSKCTLTMDDCENVILDHCSISWGPWDDVHITNANNITFQYCIISEGIEPQRFGAITDGTRNWTIAHCLWIDNKSRNPKMKCAVRYYNNVVYNFGMGIIGGHSAADNYQDVMNNYFIAGPSGSQKYFDDWTATDHLYSTGNYFDGNCNGVLDGWLITDYNNATPMSSPNFPTTMPQKLLSAQEAYADVVEQAGASKVRDIHDRRYIEQLTSLGTKGAFIANEDDVGGIGIVERGQAPLDTDRDGMPDEWEIDNGLNPSVFDANNYSFGNGYTNIENYINGNTELEFSYMYPANFTARLRTRTSVELEWTNSEPAATETVVEMSTDNVTFTEIQRLKPTVTSCNVNRLTRDQLYYFRAYYMCGEEQGPYSAVASVNDEFMKPGGGTPSGETTFTPADGTYYRILNYASKSYNSGADMTGPPKYLKILDNGLLGAVDSFDWTDETLFWDIASVEGGYEFRHVSTGKYIAPQNASIGGVDRIGSTSAPSVLTLTYIGDQTPSQSNTTKALSFYRINSPAASDQQIRARTFGDDWFWGSGTLTRADMIFTIGEVKGLVPTSIHRFTLKDEGQTIYDLSGRHLQPSTLDLQPGIYIVNGKKVLIK